MMRKSSRAHGGAARPLRGGLEPRFVEAVRTAIIDFRGPGPMSAPDVDTARGMLKIMSSDHSETPKNPDPTRKTSQRKATTTRPRSVIRRWAWDQKVPRNTARKLFCAARGLSAASAERKEEVMALLCKRQKPPGGSLGIIVSKLRQEILAESTPAARGDRRDRGREHHVARDAVGTEAPKPRHVELTAKPVAAAAAKMQQQGEIRAPPSPQPKEVIEDKVYSRKRHGRKSATASVAEIQSCKRCHNVARLKWQALAYQLVAIRDRSLRIAADVSFLHRERELHRAEETRRACLYASLHDQTTNASEQASCASLVSKQPGDEGEPRQEEGSIESGLLDRSSVLDRSGGNNVDRVVSPGTTDGGTSREEGEGEAQDVPAGVSSVAAVEEDGSWQWRERRIQMLADVGVGFLGTLAEDLDDDRRFRIDTKIAEGGTAAVWSLALLDPQEHASAMRYTGEKGLVVKSVTEGADRLCVDALAHEIRLLRRLCVSPHPSVVDTLSVDEGRGRIVMVKEDADFRDVIQELDVMHSHSKAHWMRLLAGPVEALIHLHDMNIITGDIKPANILVDKELSCMKLTDFGLGGVSGEDLVRGGTPQYAAPEILGPLSPIVKNDKPMPALRPAHDIYSIGMVALQTMAGAALPMTDGRVLFDFHDLIEDGPVKEVLSVLRGYIHDEECLEAVFDNYESFGSMGMRMGDLRDSFLSEHMFPAQNLLVYPEAVKTIFRGILHRDPRRRMPLRIFQRLLLDKRVWAETLRSRERVDLTKKTQEFIERLEGRMAQEHEDSEGAWFEQKGCRWWEIRS